MDYRKKAKKKLQAIPARDVMRIISRKEEKKELDP